jgi:hypothetical protein
MHAAGNHLLDPLSHCAEALTKRAFDISGNLAAALPRWPL